MFGRFAKRSFTRSFLGSFLFLPAIFMASGLAFASTVDKAQKAPAEKAVVQKPEAEKVKLAKAPVAQTKALSTKPMVAVEKQDQSFLPSYITIKGHRKLTPDDWTDPKICGQCHPRQYRGWNGSMHSNAFKDPVFQALWAMAEKATDGKMRNHCGGCHSPSGTATGTIKFDPKMGKHGGFTADPISEQGISCDICHTIAGSNIQKTAVLEHGNTSIILDPGNVKRSSIEGCQISIS